MDIRNIVEWIKGVFHKGNEQVNALATVVVNRKPRPVRPTSRNNKVYLNDPTTPNLMIDPEEPATTFLAMRSVGESGGGYPLGSIQQQALALKQMVNDSLNYMVSKSPKPVTRWAAVQSLVLMARAGKDINAYYDRGSLRFFYFGDPVRKRNVFACDSRPVVAHEFGHAFLDVLRPDWWDTQAVEIWSYHEAFGDMTALLTALNYDQLIDAAIAETGGDLNKSNVMTRLAADMGVGLYNLTQGKGDVLPNCLREMTARFDYVPPETLPKDGPQSRLINECHSFSRVFTGAFYKILIMVAQKNAAAGVPLKDALKQARDTMARYLLSATVSCPTTVRLFDAIARQMLQVDKAEGGKYQDILTSVFNERRISRPQVMMLDDVDMTTFLNDLKEPHEVQTLGEEKVVRTMSTKTLKLVDKLGLMALNDNPLLNLEITVPDESAYYFNSDGKLVDMVSTHEDEVVDAAFNCLNILHHENLVGSHATALFEVKYGKLVRKQIVCKCNKPNYCDPNAPEYGKPWKPKNNSGCVACHSNCEPRSCDCEQPETTPAPKIGCFTTTKVGGRLTYKYGSSASRRVC